MVMRNFPWCVQTGEIAGFAAAESVARGIVPKDYPVTCYSLTGYSGGGRKAAKRRPEDPTDFDSFRNVLTRLRNFRTLDMSEPLRELAAEIAGFPQGCMRSDRKSAYDALGRLDSTNGQSHGGAAIAHLHRRQKEVLRGRLLR